MKGCLVILAVSFAPLVASFVLPICLIGSGRDDFEGREWRMASRAYFHVLTYYGESFLQIREYMGPPLVLRWRVYSVKGCPALPPGKRLEKDNHRAYAGASAKIGAYTFFGIPLGRMEVACSGHRRWMPYF